MIIGDISQRSNSKSGISTATLIGPWDAKGKENGQMVGITSIGTYLPIYRLSSDEIAAIWAGRGTRGTKAVAGYDEDTVTMAVAAALDCINRGGIEPRGLSLATTTAPYREKQSAAIVAGAVDLPKEKL